MRNAGSAFLQQTATATRCKHLLESADDITSCHKKQNLHTDPGAYPGIPLGAGTCPGGISSWHFRKPPIMYTRASERGFLDNGMKTQTALKASLLLLNVSVARSASSTVLWF